MNSICPSATPSSAPHTRRRTTALLAIFLFIAGAARAAIIDRIAAIVNADVITQSEVEAVQKLGLNVSALPSDEGVLQERIDHHLVLQQIARQPPLTVAPERVQEIVDSIVQKYGGEEEFLMFLHSIGMNYQDFDKELREQLNIQAFITLRFRPFVNVTIDEAEQYYDDVYKRRFELAGQPAPPFAVSFDQIQKEIIESQVQQRTRQWLEEIRQSANIAIKE